MNTINDKCQKFTPRKNVLHLLEEISYQGDIFNKKVLENACGDGNILKEVIRIYINNAFAEKYSPMEIKEGLENNIYGIEIDKKHWRKCKKNLSDIASEFGIEDVNWKILNQDSLKQIIPIKFDYLIGNPPYITYQEIDLETRKFVKENFVTCQRGKFDYCYAFIESSINYLNDDGRMAYLVPSSIFKNVFGEDLRKFIKPVLKKIIDYSSIKVFPDAITSSSIIIIDKKNIRNYVYFKDIKRKTEIKVVKKNLTGKWIFKENNKRKNMNGKRFGDYFKVSNSVATQRNGVYVIKEFEEVDDGLKLETYFLEKGSYRPTASPRSLARGKDEFIIFPYYYDDSGVLRKYSEEQFSLEFPGTYEYLTKNKKTLEDRDSDESSQWFEYGRSQALAHLNVEKLLISPIFSHEMKVYNLSREIIPYSGFYITNKEGMNLKECSNILKSSNFLSFVNEIGTPANSSSMRITVKDIENFKFS